MASGGSIALVYQGNATVNITGRSGTAIAFTVDGSPITFPYSMSSNTKFETAIDGQYTLSVLESGTEIAADPDGGQDFDLFDGRGEVIRIKGDGSSATLSGQFVSALRELATNFTGKSGTQVRADTSQAWINTNNAITGSGLSVIAGKLTNTASNAGTAAGYLTAQLGATVARIGAEFTFSAYSTAGGNITLPIWKTAPPAGTFGVIPDSPCHFSVSPTGWGFSVANGGSLGSALAVGNFLTPLTADGITVYRAEVNIVGNTAYLLLPDGTTATVSDPRIGGNAGRYACFEVYQSVASTDTKGAFTRVWSDSTTYNPTDGRASTGESIRRLEGLKADLTPQSIEWGVAPSATVTLTTSMAQVDPTGMTITFKVPASGTVMVDVSCYMFMAASARVLWQMKVGGSGFLTTTVLNSLYTGNVRMRRKWTGLTPYQTVTASLWAQCLTASTAQILSDSAAGYFNTITITPL